MLHQPLEVTRVEESLRLPPGQILPGTAPGTGSPRLPLPARPGALMDGNQGGGAGAPRGSLRARGVFHVRPAGSTPVTGGSHLPADLCRGRGWSEPHGPRRCPVSPGSSGGARGQPRGGSDTWEAWQTFWTRREKSFGSSMGGRSSCRGRSRSSGRFPLLSRALTQAQLGLSQHSTRAAPRWPPGPAQREETGVLGQRASPGSKRRPALGQPRQGAPPEPGSPAGPSGVPHRSKVGTR